MPDHRNRYRIKEAGPTLDAGPFVAALEVAAQTEAELVGKPAPALFEMAAATLGVAVDRLAVVGDDPEMDIEGARPYEAMRLSGLERTIASGRRER